MKTYLIYALLAFTFTLKVSDGCKVFKKDKFTPKNFMYYFMSFMRLLGLALGAIFVGDVFNDNKWWVFLILFVSSEILRFVIDPVLGWISYGISYCVYRKAPLLATNYIFSVISVVCMISFYVITFMYIL